ncbi:hypothetical protein BDP81DRAFT_446982 [Colletotrichum phormii]|uniref:Uncharacterized protein n=1 Tax=Colletotrichum phormii TaxID=359342 RepID=A0AAJ0A1H7_9PEZI|nr:uncharacterized protein BDP81DRAFT_446982 [Colletotrichum phormii]KAK1640739.1 hypothetical protein BDP81DRAFT_446982 [Colletotrichum phormii]
MMENSSNFDYDGYDGVQTLQSTAHFANDPKTRTRSTRRTTSTSSVKAHKNHEASKTFIRITTSSTSSATPTHSDFLVAFAQMVNLSDPKLYNVSKDQLLTTPFGNICPSGNCVDDCKNMTRVFQAIPEGLDVDPLRYGRMEAQESNVALLSTCSNLEFAANFATAEENRSFTPYLLQQ